MRKWGETLESVHRCVRTLIFTYLTSMTGNKRTELLVADAVCFFVEPAS